MKLIDPPAATLVTALTDPGQAPVGAAAPPPTLVIEIRTYLPAPAQPVSAPMSPGAVAQEQPAQPAQPIQPAQPAQPARPGAGGVAAAAPVAEALLPTANMPTPAPNDVPSLPAAPKAATTPAAPAPAPAKSPDVPTPPAPTGAKAFLHEHRGALIGAGGLIIVAVLAVSAWLMLRPHGPGAGFASGNGRIEATEIDVAAKLAGRVEDILVDEGDFVVAGQVLAHMQVQTLDAQRDEAQANRMQSLANVVSKQADVAARQGDRQAALASVLQRQSELDVAQLRLTRSQTLEKEGASSAQELDDDRARVLNSQASVHAAAAQAAAAQAAVNAADASVSGARAAVVATEATVARVVADINDSALTAPRAGRIQYRVAEPGEVLGVGGKVLNLVDLSDVYMTFFVPESVAGKLSLGSEVHLILDAAPQYVIESRVSFVASTAQFTPKTVETSSERQALMFRVKARIDPELLKKNLRMVKTGIPGVAWVRVDPNTPWPAALAVKEPS